MSTEEMKDRLIALVKEYEEANDNRPCSLLFSPIDSEVAENHCEWNGVNFEKTVYVKVFSAK